MAPQADTIINVLGPDGKTLGLSGFDISIAGVPIYSVQRRPVSGTHWALLVPLDQAETVWQAIQSAGAPYGLRLAGSLTYNTLRIRAGRPAAGYELTRDYIPLEAGLWDEVNFHKGCYTGQEIIARMESRNRLAKTLVTLRLQAFVAAPAILYENEKAVGTLTSSVTTPDGEHLGLGFVKIAQAVPGQTLLAGETRVKIEVTALAGTPPPLLTA
ncbi:MAG TPA: hypothetical protein VHO69_12520 [Phototrophicaceae bacterium]|nr:hypothetical protein [Phototrophicaceae bacterium]